MVIASLRHMTGPLKNPIPAEQHSPGEIS